MEDRLEEAQDRVESDELLVRAFIATGLLVWLVATVGAYMSGQGEAFYGYGALAAFVLIVLVVGWFYERVAAMLLVLAAGSLVAWGVLAGWEIGVWLMVGAMVIVPILATVTLYSLAEYEEEVIERAERGIPARLVGA